MNKTLLLILCDFLLLNLLALTNWQTAEPKAPETRSARLEAARAAAAKNNPAKPATESDDVLSLMQLALNDERTRREQLANQLHSTRQTLQTAQTELRQTQAEKQRIQIEAEEKIETLTTTIQAADRERTELKAATETLQTRVETERKDRVEAQTTTTKLAENVGDLAKGAAETTKTFRETQGVTPNAIARLFHENKLTININATRPGFFGTSNKKREATTVIAIDPVDKTLYALMHIDATPFRLTEKPRDWSTITAQFQRGAHTLPIAKFSFLEIDPRIIAVPLTQDEAVQLGYKSAYRLPEDPFKFSEGVFITKRRRALKVTFEFNPETPGYAQIVTNVDPLNKNPAAYDNIPESGDLIFSNNAEVLGIMVNSDYCILINTLKPSHTIESGNPAPATTATFTDLQTKYKTIPRQLR